MSPRSYFSPVDDQGLKRVTAWSADRGKKWNCRRTWVAKSFTGRVLHSLWNWIELCHKRLGFPDPCRERAEKTYCRWNLEFVQHHRWCDWLDGSWPVVWQFDRDLSSQTENNCAHTMHNVHTVHTLCTHCPHTILHNVHTVYTLCTHYFAQCTHCAYCVAPNFVHISVCIVPPFK